MPIEPELPVSSPSAATAPEPTPPDRLGLGVLRALGDEVRLGLLTRLRERPRCAEELAGELGRSASTISFHLKKLEETGLILGRRSQYYTYYHVNEPLLETRLVDLLPDTPPPPRPGRHDGSALTAEVTAAFFRDGRLVRLPRQHRKRRVVLDRFLALFAPGERLDETEVDARLRTLFDDHCTIRRLLVDEGRLVRDGRVYRRPAVEAAMTNDPSRADLKRAYKDAPRQAGIFLITNLESGRVLLGSSLNLHGPLNRHRFMLTIGRHEVPDLQADWDRLGPDGFRFEVVAVVEPSPEPGFDVAAALTELEQAWVERLQPFGERGYNQGPRIRI